MSKFTGGVIDVTCGVILHTVGSDGSASAVGADITITDRCIAVFRVGDGGITGWLLVMYKAHGGVRKAVGRSG